MNSTSGKIILGTVQFGQEYGINNIYGKPDPKHVFALLDYAHAQGVNILDSADAYGNAPDLIGSYHESRTNRFSIITKFKAGPRFDAQDWLEEQLKKFSIRVLYASMFHDFQDYLDNRAVISGFRQLIKKGLIQRIGVSIYTNQQLAAAIEDTDISLIQLPFNLLDNHFQRGALLARAKNKGKEIHVRSVFLQGLFFMDLQTLPGKLIELKPSLEKLQQLSIHYDIPLANIALAYAAARQDIDKVLMGVDTLSQLKVNLENYNQSLPAELVQEIDALEVRNVNLLNPTNWK